MTSRSEELSSNLGAVRSQIANAAQSAGRSTAEITLIAVTKTYPAADVAILHELGVEDFGENRDSEGREKSSVVPATWHFQGQIQSNKIPSIAHWADVIHSLDDPRHVRIFGKTLPESKILRVFLQVCLDPQPGRGGVSSEELPPLAELVLATPSLHLEGLMAVAPLGENPESAFARLALIHSDFCLHFPSATALSAGMSGDFQVAIKHGATHVRVGSSILGSRTLVR